MTKNDLELPSPTSLCMEDNLGAYQSDPVLVEARERVEKIKGRGTDLCLCVCVFKAVAGA